MIGIDQYTKLLLHMDDGNFTDKMGNAVTNNGVVLDTNIKKFGAGSGYFNGSSSYLIISDNNMFNSSDFTYDFRLKTNNSTNTMALIRHQAQPASSRKFALNLINGKLNIYLSSNGTSWNLVDPTTGVSGKTQINLNEWNHVAFVKNGLSVKVFLNGIVDIDLNIVSDLYKYDNPIYVGYSNISSIPLWYNGYIDELRFSNIARWTNNFTPPSLPYGTVCLIQNKTNALKTIQNGNIVDLVETTPTEELFQTQGFNDVTLINSVALEPESKILTWTDNTLATKIELKYEISPFRIMDNPTNYNLKMYTDNVNATSAILNYNCESYRPVDKANPQFDIVMYKE